MSKLMVYLDMLETWNRSFNLSARGSSRDDLAALCAESGPLAAFLDGLPLPDEPLFWDLGSGAGLPGIPLRLLCGRGEYWLVESRQKRALFLANAVARLDLPRTFVHRGRAEDFFARAGRRPDVILSRAFMPWPKLLPFVRPWLSPRGFLVVLANARPPLIDPACGYALYAATDHEAGMKHRHIWALSTLESS